MNTFFLNMYINDGYFLKVGELIYTCKMIQTRIFSRFSQPVHLFQVVILQCLAEDYQVWTLKNVQVDWTWKKYQVGSSHMYRLIPDSTTVSWVLHPRITTYIRQHKWRRYMTFCSSPIYFSPCSFSFGHLREQICSNCFIRHI